MTKPAAKIPPPMKATSRPPKPRIEAVDLFCGVGGLTRGLKDAGIRVRAGYDIDPCCEHPYRTNNGSAFVLKSVAEMTGEDIEQWYTTGAVRLLAGCAPCQPFSTLASTKETRDESKWGLLGEFARLVEEVEPELVTMENVPRVQNHAPYAKFVETLKTAGYHIATRQLRCAKLGLPQDRRRFVLIASRLGAVRFDEPSTKLTTVRQAIGHLPKLVAGANDPKDPLHKARSLTKLNLSRMRASVPGGTWRDWPERLRAGCHKTETGASYQSVYARMEWDKPSPTITTQFYNFGTGRFGHPEQDRAITLREAAILQSFPADYEFVPDGAPVHFSHIGRLIGNAVPPALGKFVGALLQKHVKESNGI